MNDNTEYLWSIINRIEIPPKMSKCFIEKLKQEHPEPLAIDDSTTYEYSEGK